MYSQDLILVAKHLSENLNKTGKEISELLNISIRTFWYWKKNGFEHLEKSLFQNTKNKAERKEKVLEVIKENPFLTQKEIAQKVGLSQMSVCRYLKEENYLLKK